MKLRQRLAGPIVRTAQRFFERFGFELRDCRSPFPHIRGAEFYQPTYFPWVTPEWKQRLRADDPRSLVPLDAKYILYCSALDATRRCNGDLAECGVYKGGTARILADLARERRLHLFDTFSGMPETDSNKDIHKMGDFSDTSLDSVKQYLAKCPNVSFNPGLIPHSLGAVRDRAFSFVHIDLDIYSAIKSACEFFYTRLQSGGTFLFDDYGYPSCPGARLAVDEFFSDKPETEIVMSTGQCIVRKL